MPGTQIETIDYQTLHNIIINLVTAPNDVQIDRVIDEKGVLLSVMVNAKDMGILIGRNGIMANSIKTIMRALGKAHEMNVRVEFLEPDGSSRVATKSQDDFDHTEPVGNDDLQAFAMN